MTGPRDALDRLIGLVTVAARWLALPVALLLFLQWPLREVVRAYSREANDLGQWLFALYVAAALTAATRAGLHLRADAVARLYPDGMRAGLERSAALLALLPWAVFLLVAGWPTISASLAQLERFPETGNPGYFAIKLAAGLLALLMIGQALLDLTSSRNRSGL